MSGKGWPVGSPVILPSRQLLSNSSPLFWDWPALWPGFLTVNRHLTEEELAGLGWQILQPLVDNPRRGEDALATAISALVTFSCACKLCTAELANLLLQMCASTVLSMSVKVGRLRSREAIAIE